jgi:hypothetical protein
MGLCVSRAFFLLLPVVLRARKQQRENETIFKLGVIFIIIVVIIGSFRVY